MKKMSEVTQVEGWKEIDDENDPDSISLRVIPDHTVVYEISGPMFFAAAGKILEISFKEDTRFLVIRMRSVNAIDATALHSLEQLYEDCRKRNITIILSHVNEQPMQAFAKAGFDQMIGRDNFCPHIDDALSRAKELGGR